MITTENLTKDKNINIGIYKGSVTDLDLDAIVNPSNKKLWLGFGVSGAIRKEAGEKVRQECKNLIKEKRRIPFGEAVHTSGGDLKAKYIIHVVGTKFFGSNEALIRNSVKNSLNLAYQLGIKSIAYPAIGTGAGLVSIDKCAYWMIDETSKNLKLNSKLENIVFALFTEDDYAKFKKTILNYYKNLQENLSR